MRALAARKKRRNDDDDGDDKASEEVTSSDIIKAPSPQTATPDEDRKYTVRAVTRVCSILNLLQDSVDGAPLVKIGKTINLPKASAFRYLWTLEKHRYVERDPETGYFRLGIGFIGMQSRPLEVLQERARPWLESLRDEHGETANLGMLEGETVVYLDIVESLRGVRLANTSGARDSMHSTALGKAIAAHLPETRVRKILEQTGMPAVTPNTITNIGDYIAELAKVRRVGYAVDNAENEIDGRCVAVPILGSRLAAAISISAPASRFTMQDVETVAKSLKAAAEQLAVKPTGDAGAPKDAS